VCAFQEKIAPTGWENALPLRFIDDDAPARAAVSGCLEDGRELVGVVKHAVPMNTFSNLVTLKTPLFVA